MNYFHWDEDLACYKVIEDVTPEQIEAAQVNFEMLPVQFLSLMD
jgi:hypothetical protein